MKNSLYDIFAEKWGNDIYVYSDPHFGDFDSYKMRGLLTIVSEEQFNALEIEMTYDEFKQEVVKQLDQMQIDDINKKCGKASTLIILGDIGDVKCVKKLKAKYKILIMGNHDKGASNYTRRIITHYMLNGEIVNGHDNNPDLSDLVAIHGDIDWQGANIKYIKHRDGYTYGEWFYFADGSKGGTYTEDNKLFDEVYEGTLQIGPKLILSHEPVNCDYALNIHGHMHSSCINDIYHLNVIGEMTDYEPMNLSKIIKNGYLKDIKDIHRQTIDKATERKNSNEKI